PKSSGLQALGVTTPHTVPGLINGVTYTFGVTAKNDAGESTESLVSGMPSASSGLPVDTPVISPFGGTGLTPPKAVTLTCATAGAQIYYTTDGSDPTTSSTLYSGALNLTVDTVLKAKAFKTGMLASFAAVATFTFA